MQVERSAIQRRLLARTASCALAVLAIVSLTLTAVAPASAQTLDRIKEAGSIRLGYQADAAPFAFKDESGNPAGYAVALCQKVVEQVKTDLSIPTLAVEWVPVTSDDRFSQVQQGSIDLLCGPDSVTLSRRKDVSFSIPIFAGGIGAVVRADTAADLRRVLAEEPAPTQPIWRGSPAATVLGKKSFAVVSGTTAGGWLADRLTMFQIDSKAVPVENYEAGLKQLADHKVDAFFGDRVLLLGAMQKSPAKKDLVLLDRLFTREPLALALARGDEDLVLLVDRTLSDLYRSGEIRHIYTKWCGEPDESSRGLFQWSGLPQ